MEIKTVALVVALATLSAGFVLQQPTPLNLSNTDPTVLLAYDTHQAFLDKIDVQPPYAYAYGYELEDVAAGTRESQYESRYGDIAFGTRTLFDADGGRTVVDYSVGTKRGFYAVTRKDYPYQKPAAPLGLARLAAPLSFGTHPSPEVYAAYTTVYKDPETISKAGPLGVSAYKAHTAFLSHTRAQAPFRYSWGYEVHEALVGRTKSQYESYYGDAGEGNYALLEPGGGIRTIDYMINDNGFAVATPAVYTINNLPLVYV